MIIIIYSVLDNMKKIDPFSLPSPLNDLHIEGRWDGEKKYPGQNLRIRHEVCGTVFPTNVARWKLMADGKSNILCPHCKGKPAPDPDPDLPTPDYPERSGPGRPRKSATTLTYEGQTLTLAEWSKRTSIPLISMYNRMKRAKAEGKFVSDAWVIFGKEIRRLDPDKETERLISDIREALAREIGSFIDGLMADRLQPMLLGWIQASHIDPSNAPTGRKALIDKNATYSPVPNPHDDEIVAIEFNGSPVSFMKYREHFGDEAALSYLDLTPEERKMHLEDPDYAVDLSPPSDGHKASAPPTPPPVSLAPAPVSYREKGIMFQATSEEKAVKAMEVDTWFKLKIALPDGFDPKDPFYEGPLARSIQNRGQVFDLYVPDIPPGIMAHTNLLAQHLTSLRSVPLERKARTEELARLAHTPYSGGMAIDPEAYSRDFLPLLTEIDHPVEFLPQPLSDDVWEDLYQTPWYQWHLKSKSLKPCVEMAPLYRSMWERLWGWREMVTRRYLKKSSVYIKDNLYDPDRNPTTDDGIPWWTRLINTVADPDWYGTYTHLETSVMLDSLYMEMWIRTNPEATVQAKVPEIRAKIDKRLSGTLHGVTLSQDHMSDLRFNMAKYIEVTP